MTAAYDIAAVRKRWEGYETELVWGRYPIEHDPIRRHCHMVDDLNPRYLERGECLPVMADYFASAGPWPPAELDILALVRKIPAPGARLGARHRVLSIEARSTKLDPLSVWVRTETTIVDQLGDTITVAGPVTRRWRDGEHHALDLDVWIENPRDGVATPGRATVYLPSRPA